MAITDLTNTTWVFNDTITQLPQSPYYINFSASWAEFDKEVLYWKGLGVDKDQRGLWAGLITQDGSSISATGSEQLYSSAFGFWLVDKTITITGGIDVRSPDLISWLEANGTLQGGETSAPKLYIGNKAVTSMSIGNKAILKMYVGNSLIYEKASGEESVSITLDHQSEGLQAVSNYDVYVKFGTQPTSGTDYDYYFNPTSNGGYVYDSANTRVTTPFTTNVKPIAYIWSTIATGWATYSLNGGAKQEITPLFDYGYENAVEVQLQNGDTLTVYTAVPD